MDIFAFLSYINKISLLAFFVTTLVVVYQVYIFKKEKSKEQAPIIPDFKEKNNLNEAANFTNLPSYLTKKELKAVNYSKFIFLIISLLTIIVVIFVVSLVKKNNYSNEALNNTPAITRSVTPTIIKSKNSPTPTPSNPVPTVSAFPTLDSSPTVEPTEIVLAKNPSLTPTTSPTESSINKPQVLPETGSWEKGLLIIGVAISTIFFSFWL